jgi:phosphohistidine phosphatase
MSRTISLYLLRHAHAGDPEKWHGSDDVRPLSEKGRLQAERLGLFLAEVGFSPDAILSSPKTRALETARLVATPLERPVVVRDELGEPLDLAGLNRLLEAVGNPGRPVLVGHDPDFSDLASELAGVPDLPIRKGALVRIDSEGPLREGGGLLRWLVPPDLLDHDQGGN